MNVYSQAPRYASVMTPVVIAAAGPITGTSAPLAVQGPNAELEWTDGTVQVVLGVADPGGILVTPSLAVEMRWESEGVPFAGEVVPRRQTTAMAEAVPVACPGSLVGQLAADATGPGTVFLSLQLSTALQRVEVTP